MKENAILLTAGILDQPNAKTAHGLIRTSSRYHIIAVIDKHAAGRDAGELLDGIRRDIPVYASLAAFQGHNARKATKAIIGVALPGGKFTGELLSDVEQAIKAGLSIVSGMHDFLTDNPEVKRLAELNGVDLIDIRKPRPKELLKFWSGEIAQVNCPVIAVLGTDCALGKRTTACMVTEGMQSRGYNAQMIFTGQTGWLQGHPYGFILDSTYNDFISGELENAVLSCYKGTQPDVIFIEGQSALCNPSGPCGSEMLLSAGCKAVILQHAPARVYYNGFEGNGIKIAIEKELAMIRLLGAEVLAITFNTAGLTLAQAKAYQEHYENTYGIPVILPLEEGADHLVSIVQAYGSRFHSANIHEDQSN